jgi:hypothetical protein
LHHYKCSKNERKVAGSTILHIHFSGIQFFTLPIFSSSWVYESSLSVVLKIRSRLRNKVLSCKQENK